MRMRLTKSVKYPLALEISKNSEYTLESVGVQLSEGTAYNINLCR